MGVPSPHFLLFSEARHSDERRDWRFVLQSADGSHKIEVEDAEPDLQGERLELLAVVRGLEALDQPSRVTLVTPSTYVRRGLKDGLDEWRSSDWQWERHGEMVPVKNHDLWQRVDHALNYHEVDCRAWRFDAGHSPARTTIVVAEESPERVTSRRPAKSFRHRLRRLRIAFQRYLNESIDAWRLRLAQCGTCFLPSPWLQ
jgi:ribonuclease HI